MEVVRLFVITSKRAVSGDMALTYNVAQFMIV